jgi:ZIP family zinc transporter
MLTVDLIGLGAVAGVIPVYLGLVSALWLGKVLPRSAEGFLIGLATGVLVYLFFDLMHESVELTGARDPASSIVFLGSLFIGFIGLVVLEWSQIFGQGSFTRLVSLPYMIAVGMGLHNFGEGLAIGASYANGEWGLSGLLVAGFALHNGTEGFGITGSAGKAGVSWSDVLVLGFLAGGPTCLGTLLSGHVMSSYLSLACYALAAGSLLYVIVSLVALSYTASRRLRVALGVFCGISLMYVTAVLLALAGRPLS